MSHKLPVFVRCRHDVMMFNVEVYLYYKDIDGSIARAEPVEFVMKRANRAEVVNPTFRLEQETAQAFMDALWDCGIRPAQGTGSAGSLAATERHLEDMRKLVFDVKTKKNKRVEAQ